MRAAMKQNPNMIRTLLGLSFSLIFLLGYAVYGATNDSGYYLYFSEHEETNPELISVGQHPVLKDGKTVWVWEFDVNPSNLTWINVSVTDVYEGSMLKVTNVAGNFWSHPELGNALESGVNCADKIKEGGEYICAGFIVWDNSVNPPAALTILGAGSNGYGFQEGGELNMFVLDIIPLYID